MTNSEDQSSKERIEEISVTEVSDQVLQELSGLFSSRDGVTVVEPVELGDITVTDVIDLVNVVAGNNTPHDIDLPDDDYVVISDSSVDEILRSEPIDPLLNGMAEDTGTLVVIDDDLDR